MSKQKVGTFVYSYRFGYFGEGTFKGKRVSGICVELAIHVYKNGKEVVFSEEPCTPNGRYLCQVFKVSFCRKNLYTVTRNLIVDNLFRLSHEWDKIEAEAIGYAIDYEKDEPSEDITKQEFTEFISRDMDQFDIPDNAWADPLTVYIKE